MRQPSRNPFAAEVTSDEEFDELVSELLHVEPPPSLVDTILSSVSKISLRQIQLEQEQVEEDQEGLVVRHSVVQPS